MLNFVARFIGPIGAVLGLVTSAGGIAARVFLGIRFLPLLSAAVEFLKTPLGQVIAAVAIAVVLFFAGDIRGARVESTYYQKREAAAASEAAQKIEAQKELAAQLAHKQAAELQQENQDLNQKVAEYEKALSARKGSCPLGADDIKRLRQLAK